MSALLDQQLALRERPDLPVVTKQVWSMLTFLHWPVNPDAIQRLLPEGLEVDVFEGQAYVGLVPFIIDELKHPRLPNLKFCETNVRTYVTCRGRNPGVWFFSLDAASMAAVIGARSWYGLPYFYSKMDARREDVYRSYGSERPRTSRRRGKCSVIVKEEPETRLAEPGSLEFFLFERYLLYALRRGRLLSGQVHHEPYQIADAKVFLLMQTLLADSGIEVQEELPALAHWAETVKVEAFAPQPVDW